MRAALAELAATSADGFPRAAGALSELLAEPMSGDPANDELWVNLVVGLAEEQVIAALAVDARG
jgi:hypothetical protein